MAAIFDSVHPLFFVGAVGAFFYVFGQRADINHWYEWPAYILFGAFFARYGAPLISVKFALDSGYDICFGFFLGLFGSPISRKIMESISKIRLSSAINKKLGAGDDDADK